MRPMRHRGPPLTWGGRVVAVKNGCAAFGALLLACGGLPSESGELGTEGATSRAASTLGEVGPLSQASMTSSELIGRPTSSGVTLKASMDRSIAAYVEYGSSSGTFSSQTSTDTFADGMIEIPITGLDADKAYYYRLRYRETGASSFAAGSEHRFRTQRARSSSFTFDVQSDSHQGYQPFYSGTLYGITLENIASDQPDFLFDLGDTVSTDDATETAASVRQKYADQRASFNKVGHSSPVFLVLGNHENEEGWNLDDTGDIANSLPVLGANARKRYFLNPVPNAFYGGNSDVLAALDGDHLRGDYYAFEWGSALFVAIDPFWYTTRKPYAGALGGEKNDETVGDRWDWTLGKTQYDWLKATLENSTAPFKFVFAHHSTGGSADYVRGGASGAKYCEWGGYDPDDGTYAFDAHRPGWGTPVHRVLAENGVSAFFHGHDHVFAKEELDGVVYQECPQSANPSYDGGFTSNAADYANAARVNNSGHLRVTVTPTLVTVSYVRAYLPGDGDNGSVAYSYAISPCAVANSDGKVCDDGNTAGACAAGICVAVSPTGGSAGADGEGGQPGAADGGEDAGGPANGGSDAWGGGGGGIGNGMNAAGGEGGVGEATQPPREGDVSGAGGSAAEPGSIPSAESGGASGRGGKPSGGSRTTELGGEAQSGDSGTTELGGGSPSGGVTLSGGVGPAGDGRESAALRGHQQSGCSCSTPSGGRGNGWFVALGCLLGLAFRTRTRSRG